MELEYVFKMFILIVVVLIIITMMWQFRDKIVDVCLFPPCDKQGGCNVQPIISEEERFSIMVLDKYCNLCWMKNGGGKCKDDSSCYVLNLKNDFIPGTWPSTHDYCIVTCENAASSLYVQYRSEGNGYIEIAC